MFSRDDMMLFDSPFSGEVNEHSFFPYPSLTESVTRIRRHMEGVHRVLLVTGEAGSGKSLMVKQILALDEERWRVSFLTINGTGKRLKVYAMERETLPIVMLDDAHLLEPETLAALVKATSGEEGERLFEQLVILGSPKLSTQVDGLRHLLPPRDSVSEVEIPPMDISEVRTYISGHLRAAGHSGGFPFSEGQLERIHTLSKGFPGGVNREASKELSRLEEPAPQEKKGLFGRLFGK